MKQTLLAATCVIACGCGGGGGGSTPTTPTPPAQTNRAPSITAMTMTGFGIQQLTQFSYSGSASDPDGDSLTYTWDLAGNAASGTSGTISFANGANAAARLTVSDGKGGTASDTRSFVIGSMTGRWTGSWGGWLMTSNITQSGPLVTGDYSDQLGPGRMDTAVANSIDANGNIRIRYKQAIFSDFIFTGTMDTTGRRITGVVNGSGVNNTPFTMNK